MAVGPPRGRSPAPDARDGPPPRPDRGKGLLVVLRALGLGDLLTAVPALRALATAFPHHRRVLAAPAGLAPLAGLTGAVDAVADVDLRTATGPFPPLPASLEHADVAVNLHGRGPQSHVALRSLLPDRLIAFGHPDVPGCDGGPPWRPDEHEVARWCRMLAGHGIAADPGALGLSPPLDRAVPAARDATLIHPGAASAARRWPSDRWAAVARAEHAAGRAVVVTGGPDERGLATTVATAAGLPPGAVLAGRTDPVALAATVAVAGRVVCGDTGVAHLATAVGTPSVVLFGPTSPARWGPPPDRPEHRVLWGGQEGDPHASRCDPGLLAIRVESVLAALADLPREALTPLGPPSGGAADIGHRRAPSAEVGVRPGREGSRRGVPGSRVPRPPYRT